MKYVKSYFSSILKLWLFWAWGGIIAFIGGVVDLYNPNYDFPREIYWRIIIAALLIANIKLYSDLRQKLDAYEDTRANIRFIKTEDVVTLASYHGRGSSPPYPDLAVKIDNHSGLDSNGLPAWIQFWAHLEGENKRNEGGEIQWEIKSVKLPSCFLWEQNAQDGFTWKFDTQSVFTGVDGWKDKFTAHFVVNIKIVNLEEPQEFARQLRSLSPYRVEVEYWTLRGIDNKSPKHMLVLEGDFSGLYYDLCKKWNEWRFPELAKLAGCHSDGM